MKKFIGRVEYLIFKEKCRKNGLRIVTIRCGNKVEALIGLE